MDYPKITIPIRALCIYAEADELYAQQINNQLQFLQRIKSLEEATLLSASEFIQQRYSRKEIVAQFDFILLVVSNQMLATSFCHSELLRNLIRERNLKNLQLFQIRFETCRWEESPLRSVHPLVAAQTPLVTQMHPGEDWHKRINVLSHEMERQIKAQRIFKKAVIAAWQAAKEDNTAAAYKAFLAKYPYSRYAAQATRLQKELEDKILWIEARTKDSIEAYHHYLLFNQLQVHETKAIQRIIELEEQEPSLAQRLHQEKNIALWFDYTRRFPKGKHFDSVYEYRKRQLKKGAMTLDWKIEEPNYLLQKEAGRANEAEAMLSLHVLLDTCATLGRKMKLVFRDSREKSFKIIVVIITTILMNTLNFLYFSSHGNFLSYLLLFLLFFLLIPLTKGAYHVINDMLYLRKNFKLLKEYTVRLKLNFNYPRAVSIPKILTFVNDLEKKVRTIDHYASLDYILGSQPILANKPLPEEDPDENDFFATDWVKDT